jgi:DNA repair photolyase
MTIPALPGPRGRGASSNPANRFEPLQIDLCDDADPAEAGSLLAPATRLYRDTARSALARNDSPDIPFATSLNPYRGCEHGCAYCYARPFHEYLGFSAGLDFESRILVKENVAGLLRKELTRPSWKPQVIAVSGVTDAYQPIERRLKFTRSCLEVLAEFRNPVAIITKSDLVTRDLDLLRELHRYRAARVDISLTTLDSDLARALEPRAATPMKRLDAIRRLAAAGIPVGVMVAPILPGLTESEIPAIVQAAREAGAGRAGHIVLRLPHGLGALFEEWLEEHVPDRRQKVMNRVRHLRGGRTNDPRPGTRMSGEGVFAREIRALFDLACRRSGMANDETPLSTGSFRRPMARQLGLFAE